MIVCGADDWRRSSTVLLCHHPFRLVAGRSLPFIYNPWCPSGQRRWKVRQEGVEQGCPKSASSVPSVHAVTLTLTPPTSYAWWPQQARLTLAQLLPSVGSLWWWGSLSTHVTAHLTSDWITDSPEMQTLGDTRGKTDGLSSFYRDHVLFFLKWI